MKLLVLFALAGAGAWSQQAPAAAQTVAPEKATPPDAAPPKPVGERFQGLKNLFDTKKKQWEALDLKLNKVLPDYEKAPCHPRVAFDVDATKAAMAEAYQQDLVYHKAHADLEISNLKALVKDREELVQTQAAQKKFWEDQKESKKRAEEIREQVKNQGKVLDEESKKLVEMSTENLDAIEAALKNADKALKDAEEQKTILDLKIKNIEEDLRNIPASQHAWASFYDELKQRLKVACAEIISKTGATSPGPRNRPGQTKK